MNLKTLVLKDAYKATAARRVLIIGGQTIALIPNAVGKELVKSSKMD